MTLDAHEPRCNDSGCPERNDCARWTRRAEVDFWQRRPSLFPHDALIDDPCPMKVPEDEAGGET